MADAYIRLCSPSSFVSLDTTFLAIAVTTTQQWAKLHHCRFKQFCRKNGLHKMEKFGDEVDWNESIVSIISKVLVQALVRMRKTLTIKQEEL